MTKGKLIVIEAGDGSGKATQAGKLYDRLCGEGYRVRKIDYPNYQSDSAALIKMYLRGDFGTDPGAVNPYAASAFYAVDRLASFMTDWQEFYNSGGVIIADRYTTSNMIHQAAKVDSPGERNIYLDWLWDFEFVKCGLPVPDCVIFLDMPPDASAQLMQDRPNKAGMAEKDIHERNTAYLESCYRISLEVARRYNWSKVACCQNGNLRSIEDIHQQIYQTIAHLLHRH